MNTMKIRKIVLAAIKGNTGLRRKIKEVLNISEPTLYRIIHENDDDLTKAAVMNLIKAEFELTEEEILEPEVQDMNGNR
jgi:ATP-dependent Clp protease adapter protein ClpS